MSVFKHILFPIDFSERSRALRPFVKSIAEHFNARLTLLNVVEIPLGAFGDPQGGFPLVLDIPGMIEQGRSELDSFFDGPAPGVPIEKIVEQGDPASTITGYAEQNGVDLIVMPTHGYGTFRSLLLGSVTAKVLHDARCAVWTAAHAEDPKLASQIDLRTVLCAVDLAPENAELIRDAADFAKEFNAKLRLVHAVPVTETRPEKYMDTEFSQYLLKMAREEIANLQRQAGTSLDTCVTGGRVSEVVREAALRFNADLVIIGRGKLKETLGRLRTNSYAVIRDSPCPVLSM